MAGKHSWSFQKNGEKVDVWVDGQKGNPMTKECAKAFAEGISKALASTERVTVTFECKENHPHYN